MCVVFTHFYLLVVRLRVVAVNPVVMEDGAAGPQLYLLLPAAAADALVQPSIIPTEIHTLYYNNILTKDFTTN